MLTLPATISPWEQSYDKPGGDQGITTVPAIFSAMKILRNAIVLILTASLLSTFTYAQPGNIRINEILPSNYNIYFDEDGEFSDWIELYNAGPASVSLKGWTLSDDPEVPGKWVFPEVSLESNSYLMVFASGKNRSNPGGVLHTNFKLSSSGEYLALTDPYENIITEFSPAYPAQTTNVSYGYFNGGYVSFSTPSPGAFNLAASAILPPPEFSPGHGLYDSPFQLTISSEIEGAEIYYTLDGSVPGQSSGTLFTAPFTVDRTTIVRAIVLTTEQAPSPVLTSTYIFPEDIIHTVNYPDGFPSQWGDWTYSAGRAPADYEMDPELVTDPHMAEKVMDGLESMPTMSIVSDRDNFFLYSTDPATGGIYMFPAPGDNDTGRGWERPASMELFNRDGSLSLQVNCGIEIHGGESRRPEKDPKHSFRLSFKPEYGPSRLNYPLFREGSNASINSLVLRAGFNNTWTHWEVDQRDRSQYIRDIFIKDTHREMGHLASNSIFVNLYINGIYWGIYAPSERMDADFAASYLKGGEEDFDMVKDYLEVVQGDLTAWNNLVAKANAGLAGEDAYQSIQGNLPDGSPDPDTESLLDVVSLTDYMIVNLYGGNTDWDHHNWAAVRNRVNPGTGFKFLCWDAEHNLEDLNENVTGENNNERPSRIFQKLRENDRYVRLFSDRVQKFCYGDGILTPDAVMERWLNRMEQVETAIPAEAARWGDYRRDVHSYQSGPYELYTYDDHWLAQQNYLFNTYFPQRTGILVNQLRQAGLFPELEAPVFYINDEDVSGYVYSPGDILTMTSTEGVIYYTSDGSDPADWQGQNEAEEIVLVSEDAPKKVYVPKTDIGSTWITDLNFDDSSWEDCTGSPGGIGYDKEPDYLPYISLDVSQDMHDDGGNPNNSCYIRIPFTLTREELESINYMDLDIRYDDGFIAYLNGNRVADANAPASPAWNSTSTDFHEALNSESFNISPWINRLVKGENLLVIQGLNSGSSSSDFLITAKLTGSNRVNANASEYAVMYTEGIQLENSAHVKARTYSNGNWSALNERYFIMPGDYYSLKVTEVHYHPLDEDTIDESKFEFIELKNTGTSTLYLGKACFVDGINYCFPEGTEIRKNGFIVVASADRYFAERYGFDPFDEYKGKLDNGGESIVLVSPFGDTIVSFIFEDESPWPLEADGTGTSLVPTELNPTGDQNTATQWRNSYYIGGSPGYDDTLVTNIAPEKVIRKEFVLRQNYPNPFTSLTYINYILPEQAFIKISIFNLMGQEIRILTSDELPEGSYVTEWNGMDASGNPVANGIYFYRMEVRSREGTTVKTRKMMLAR